METKIKTNQIDYDFNGGGSDTDVLQAISELASRVSTIEGQI